MTKIITITTVKPQNRKTINKNKYNDSKRTTTPVGEKS